MLILKAFVNHRQIDTVMIQNIGDHETRNGCAYYKIVEPKLKNDSIVHYKMNGWKKLAQMALSRIEKEVV